MERPLVKKQIKFLSKKVVKKNIKPIYLSSTSKDFNQRLFDFVSKGEGTFQSEAFCDDYYKTDKGLIRKKGSDCKRWSIGFGTKSYWGERITFKEGVRRRNIDLLSRKKLITSNCLSDNQKIVTLDFMYQHGNNASKVRYYANTCQVKKIKGQIIGWRDYYRIKKQFGMVKREQYRINNLTIK